MRQQRASSIKMVYSMSTSTRPREIQGNQHNTATEIWLTQRLHILRMCIVEEGYSRYKAPSTWADTWLPYIGQHIVTESTAVLTVGATRQRDPVSYTSNDLVVLSTAASNSTKTCEIYSMCAYCVVCQTRHTHHANGIRGQDTRCRR